MRTPAGFECEFFHADYHRGRNVEECRLIARNPRSERWSRGLCRDCPVPRVTRANACPHLVLEATVAKTWLGLGRRVELHAHCTKSAQAVAVPEVGCGQCHHLGAFEQLTKDE
ncbi:MAG: hypothetical protein JNK29_17090 [Anaerolineales bacterium]|nr:hypothetical protein [Anaerolineales bacterium]